MATTFSTHSLHHLQQHHQHLQHSSPSPIPHPITQHLTFNAHHHNTSPNHQQIPSPQPQPLYCKPCKTMFNTVTSYEVHVNYHRENLLRQWALQDSVTSSGCSSSGSTSSTNSSTSSGIYSNSSNTSSSSSSTMDKSLTHTPSPQASADSLTSTNGPAGSLPSNPLPINPSQHVQYFLDFVPPQYNNNTGDHHMEPSPNRPGANSFQPPVVDPHGHLYGNLVNHHHQISQQYSSHIFPPNHLPHGVPSMPSPNPNPSHDPASSNNSGSATNSGGNTIGSNGENLRPAGENPNPREPAEILDLDSHKVHVYQQQQQLQQQQQQQQQQQLYHRPYLPHLLASPHPHIPPTSNGWMGPDHQFGFPPSAGEHPHLAYGVQPSGLALPPQGSGASQYEMIRSEPNPMYANDGLQPPIGVGIGYGPPSAVVVVPPSGVNPASGNTISPPQSFNGGNNGIRPGFSIGIGSNGGGPGDRAGVRSPAHKSPPIVAGNGGLTKGSSNTPSAAPKTKGWKGGECKRPKTYNCVACNKWFTSSGHLKRHYGTTLHKNSIKQKGEMVEEGPPPKGATGKKNQRAQPQPIPHGGDITMESTEPASPSPRNIKVEDGGKSRTPSSSSSLPPPGSSGPMTMTSMYGPSGSSSSNVMTTLSSDIKPFNTSTTPNTMGNGTSNGTSSGGNTILSNHLISGGARVPSPNTNNNPNLTGNSSEPTHPSSSPYHPGPTYLPPMSPYGNNPQQSQPPSQQQQQQQQQQQAQSQQQQQYHNFHGIPPHGLHIHPPVPFSNGYAPETMPNPNSHYSVPSPIVPTTLYGGYSVISMNGETTPLPPFSTVGFSHYDPIPNTYHLGPQQQQQPLAQHQQQLQNSNPMGPYPPTSMASSSPNRMTPSGGYLPSTSPSANSSGGGSGGGGDGSSSANGNHNMTNNKILNNNHLENSFDSESNNNRDSPEELRSITGSADGSLDGLDTDVLGRGSGSGSSGSGSDGSSPSPNRTDSSGESSSQKDGEGGCGDVLKCPDCSKTFGRACYLTQHANSSHSGGKPFKCTTCGKRFLAEPALSDHVAKHGSNKPYKCTLCPKQFNHKTDLRRHLCLHTGEKPFACNTCGKGFIRKDHMNKHSETHRRKAAHNNQNQHQINNNNSNNNIGSNSNSS